MRLLLLRRRRLLLLLWLQLKSGHAVGRQDFGLHPYSVIPCILLRRMPAQTAATLLAASSMAHSAIAALRAIEVVIPEYCLPCGNQKTNLYPKPKLQLPTPSATAAGVLVG